jgi:hypothetical protein
MAFSDYLIDRPPASLKSTAWAPGAKRAKWSLVDSGYSEDSETRVGRASTIMEHKREKDDHNRRPDGIHGQVGDLPLLQDSK